MANYSYRLLSVMEKEQTEFKNYLLTLDLEEILNHSYEYIIRQDILCAFESMELSEERCKALLKTSNPIADIFKSFEKLEDADYMDSIRECIEKRADSLSVPKLTYQ